MMEGIKEFLLRHATHRSLYVKFFFANQGNMRKNIIHEPLPPKNIFTSFPALAMTEFLPSRLSTPLTNSKSYKTLSPIRFSIIFKGTEKELKLLFPRKQIEAANDLSFARTEKLGRWRGIERGMSAKGPGRMRRVPTWLPRRRSICRRQRQPPDWSRDRFRTPRGRC